MWETPVLSMFRVNVKFGNKCFLLILLSERLLSSGRAGISDMYNMQSHTIWKQAYLSRFRCSTADWKQDVANCSSMSKRMHSFPQWVLKTPRSCKPSCPFKHLTTCLGHVTWPFRKYQLACEYKEKTSSPAPLQHWLLTALDPRRKYWKAH